jgi:hypothetical protein
VRVGTRQTAQWTELPATAPGGLSTIGPVEVAHAQPVSVICRSVDCSTEVRPSGTVCSSWPGQDEGRTGTCPGIGRLVSRCAALNIVIMAFGSRGI